MDGLGGYYGKWKNSDRERQILYDITYVWNLKMQQTSEYNKKRSRLTAIENELVATSKGGRGNIAVGYGKYKLLGTR